MKKLAANYVVTDSGEFLKNSLLVTDDDGTVLEYIDTRGQLAEIAQLIFYNGILLASFRFIKVRDSISFADSDSRSFGEVILAGTNDQKEIDVPGWLRLCKKVQEYFPEMVIPEIFMRVADLLVSDGGFRRENLAGVYLLAGSDLLVLKLSTGSKLRRVL